MHRRLPALLAAAAVLLVTACSDDPGSTPTGIAPAVNLSGVAPSCAPATIRYTLAALLTDAGSKAFAIPHFNAGQQADAAGNPELAEQEYFRVISHVFGRFALGGTAQPRRYDSMQEAVFYVVLSLYACAGTTLPDGFTEEELAQLIDEIAAGGVTGDIGVAVVGPGIDFDVLVASRQFSFTGGGDFWDEAGIVVVRRIPDGPPFSTAFTEYPPRYNISVTPYSAQEHFDGGEETNEEPDEATALVTICPGEGHDLVPLSSLRVLRDPEESEAPPALLDPAGPDSDVLCDAELPEYPAPAPPVITRASPLRGLETVRGALAAVWRRLGPTPLYAVDGGIGGRVRLASDYVAAQSSVQIE